MIVNAAGQGQKYMEDFKQKTERSDEQVEACDSLPSYSISSLSTPTSLTSLLLNAQR